MTGATIVQMYDDFFVKNYQYLLGFTKSIDVKNDYENLLQDVFIVCRTRIMKSGFTGNTFLNYVRVTIMNRYKTSYRDKRYSIDIEDPNHCEEIEDILLSEHDYQQQCKDYDNEMVFLNTMAFEYVNRFFNEKENMVFRTYYVLKHKHLNYKQLSLATGYSQATVSNVIKTIKKDLRANLLTYINTGERLNELY